jgi:hypothetical protein
MRKVLLILTVLVGLFGFAGGAQADLLYTLTNGNTPLSGPPYATVNVHLDTILNIATITVDPAGPYLLGPSRIFAFNTAGMADATGALSGGTQTATLTTNGIPNVFGGFDQGYKHTGPCGPTFTDLVFNITGPATPWTGEADVFVENASGFPFQAHVFDTNLVGTTANTGFATLSLPGATVPVPGALWLLGPGLIGIAGIRKRIRFKYGSQGIVS